jgi:hypothetical protein
MPIALFLHSIRDRYRAWYYGALLVPGRPNQAHALHPFDRLHNV